MKLQGVNPPPIQTREQDRSAEVQPAQVQQTQQTQQVQQAAEQAPVKLENHQALLKRLGDPAASRVTRSASGKGVLAIKQANEIVAKGGFDRVEFQEALGQMAVAGFSAASQAKFIEYMKGREADPVAMCWAASKIRQSLPPDGTKVGALRAFFTSKGIKLFSNDKLDGSAPSHNIDRKACRQQLLDIVKAGGKIDKRTGRQLMGQLRDVADKGDLFWAHWQVQRRVLEGQLTFESPADKTRLMAMFTDKLDGAVDRKELGYMIRKMRSGGFGADDVAAVKAMLKRASNDADTLFEGERVFAREMREAQNGAAKRSPESLGHLEAVQADFEAFFAPRLEGKLDRKSLRDQTIDLYRKGEISREECGGLMSSVAVSRTPEEYAYATMSMVAQLRATQNAQILQEAWDELLDTFSRNMSDDTYDSSGNIIETVEERALKKDLITRQLDRLQKLADKTDEIAERASLRGGHSQLKAQLTTARDAGEATDMVGDMVAIEGAEADVERTPG